MAVWAGTVANGSEVGSFAPNVAPMPFRVRGYSRTSAKSLNLWLPEQDSNLRPSG